MTITVTGHDGSNFSFPDGTSETDIVSAIDGHYGTAKPEVGAVEDAVKTAAPSTLRGVLGAITTPGTLSDLAGKGAEWAINKIAPDSKAAGALKFLREIDADPKTGKSLTDQHSFFPSYDTAKDKAEKVTGPLYEAQKPLGQGVQTALEVAPSLVGGPAIGTAARAVGAGVGSVAAGEAAKAAGGILPAWAEPVSRAVGAMVGTAVGRRAVTPLPMTPERAATISALKAKDPSFPMTAGQETNSPRIMAIEGRNNTFKGLPAKQEEAFTRGTMKEMGTDGLAGNITADADALGSRIGAIRRGNEITPTEFPGLNTEIAKIVRKHTGTVGKDDAAIIADIQKKIRLGASNNTNVASVPGARYDFLRQKVQGAIDSAPTGTDSNALSDVRKALDNAFHRSIPKDASEELKALETQYANASMLKKVKPNTEDMVTPKQVINAAHGSKTDLLPFARNASKVMLKLPGPEAPHGASGWGVILGTALGAAAGHHVGGLSHGLSEGLVGGIFGGHAQDVIRSLKDAGARAVTNPLSQAYLRNQKLAPSSASVPTNKEALVRLLMSPPEVQSLPGQSR